MQKFFMSQCRDTAVILGSIGSPTFKKLLSGRKKNKEDGCAAVFNFNGYSVQIYYVTAPRISSTPCVIWCAFTFDRNELLPFSVYDLISFYKLNDFSSYTFSYVSSEQTMASCFEKLNGILSVLVSRLNVSVQSGPEYNRLIDSQKENLNAFFGDKLYSQSENAGPVGERIRNIMVNDFFETSISRTLTGGQSFFYDGNAEKALKILKKAKYRSHYDNDLLAYLENGGKALAEPGEIRSAKPKGAAKNVRSFLFGLAAAAAVCAVSSVILGGIYLLLCALLFSKAQDYTGMKELIVFFPIYTLPFSVFVSAVLVKKRNLENARSDKEKLRIGDVLTGFLKYMVIVGETIALVGCLLSINSTLVFRKDHFTFSGSNPFSIRKCYYSDVTDVALVKGYETKNGMTDEPHIVIKDKYENEYDLYDVTFLSSDEFIEKYGDYFDING